MFEIWGTMNETYVPLKSIKLVFRWVLIGKQKIMLKENYKWQRCKEAEILVNVCKLKWKYTETVICSRNQQEAEACS